MRVLPPLCRRRRRRHVYYMTTTTTDVRNYYIARPRDRRVFCATRRADLNKYNRSKPARFRRRYNYRHCCGLFSK